MTDYHDFSYRGSSKEWRKRLNIGDIYVNAAICKGCGWFIRSRNRHDFVRCNCGKIAVDGGSFYVKRSGHWADMENIIEMYDDVKVYDLLDRELGKDFWENAVLRPPKFSNKTGRFISKLKKYILHLVGAK